MKKRMRIIIVLMACMGILVHAGMPHFHGDDFFATVAHLVTHLYGEEAEDADCCHEGSHHHDGASENCAINDTIAAFACRENSVHTDFHFEAQLMRIILTDEYLFSVRERVLQSDYGEIPDPELQDPALAATAARRAPPMA